MRNRLPLLIASLLVFCVSAGLTLLALDRRSTALAYAAIVGMGISILLLFFSFFLPRRKVDWERIEVEQRLWESGPLGRSWLRTRQRLYRRFKL